MSNKDQETRKFRNAVGNFATGIVIVTGIKDDNPSGFTAQSFVSLSLEPMLVAVCPAKTSSSWLKIKQSKRFCVNILGANQRAISIRMSSSDENKFAGIQWATSPLGSPIIDGVLGYVDCELAQEHDTGDHYIAVGSVKNYGVSSGTDAPLLYFQGSYGQFETVASECFG